MSGHLTPTYGNDGGEPVRSGQLTPNTIAKQLSQLDLPAPTNLHLSSGSGSSSAPAPRQKEPNRDISDQLSKLNLPEPEAVSKAARHRRSESQSQDLSEQLARMNLPQPERIFGPNEGGSSASRETFKGKIGVDQSDWDKVKLDDDVPEAVKSPTDPRFSRDTRP